MPDGILPESPLKLATTQDQVTVGPGFVTFRSRFSCPVQREDDLF